MGISMEIELHHIVSMILQLIIGSASIIIASYVYKLNKQARSDNWYKTFNELHEAFWNDADFAKMREWIINDFEYSKIHEILKRRFFYGNHFDKEEYRDIEVIDKFFNFMLKAQEVGTQLNENDRLWEKLYFNYWVDDIINKERYLLWKYYQIYYYPISGQLGERKNISSDKLEQFNDSLNEVWVKLEQGSKRSTTKNKQY